MSDYNFEYLLNYTNASYILDRGLQVRSRDGSVQRVEREDQTYNAHTWHYETESTEDWDTSRTAHTPGLRSPASLSSPRRSLTNPKKDMTLQDPMCVYQQFKKHYSRYDIDTVCRICGMDKDVLELVYNT